jgi:hypothetical protein
LEAPAHRPSNKITLTPNRGEGPLPATVSVGPERNAPVRPVSRPSAKFEDAPFAGDEMEAQGASSGSDSPLPPRGDSRSRIDFRHDDKSDLSEDSDEEGLDDENRDEEWDDEEPEEDDLDEEEADEDDPDDDESDRETDDDLFANHNSPPNDLDDEIADHHDDPDAANPPSEGSPRPWHAESA